jgi:hypothetical protein
MKINLNKTLSVTISHISSVEVLRINDVCYGDTFDKIEYECYYHNNKGLTSSHKDYPFIIRVIMSNGCEHIISGYYALEIASNFDIISNNDIYTLDEQLKALHQFNLEVIKEYQGIKVDSLPYKEYESLKQKIVLPVYS